MIRKKLSAGAGPVVWALAACLSCMGCSDPPEGHRSTFKSEDSRRLQMLLDSAWNLGERNLDSSRMIALQALELAVLLEQRDKEAEALNRIAEAEEARGELDSAQRSFTKALFADSAAGDLHGKARDYYHISIVQKKKGNYAEALSSGLLAMDYWKRAGGHETERANACISIGNVFHRQGKYGEALHYFLQAERIADTLPNRLLPALIDNSIGMVYEKQRLYDNARDRYFSAYQKAAASNSLKLTSSAANNIGNVELAKGNYEEALHWYRNSLETAEQVGLHADANRTRDNIGLIYQGMGKYDQALFYQRRALAGLQKSDDKQALAVSFNNLGEAYRSSSDTDSAAWAFRQSVDLARSSGSRFILLEGLNNLAHLYAGQKNFVEAFSLASEYQVVRDSLEQAFREATETDISYKEEINKRVLLEKEKEKQIAESQRQQMLIYILFGSIVILGLLFFILWRMIREKQRAQLAEQQEKLNRQKIDELMREQELMTLRTMLETQEQERRRIGKDLHDGLSVKLATVKLYYSLLIEKSKVLPEEERGQVQKGWRILDDACTDLRNVAHDLVSGDLVQLGLTDAARNLCETIASVAQLSVRFVAHGMDNRPSRLIEQNAYQVIQELLANILKHAKATEVTVQLTRFNNTLNIMVEDNGVGFDTSSRGRGKGMGLANIEERVGRMGGQLHIDSSPRRGTIVSIDIKAD